MSAKDFNRPRLFAAMRKAGLDAVIASSPWNVTYTSGAYLDILKPTYLVTTADGRQALVVNEADAYNMRSVSHVKDVRDYRLGATGAADVTSALTLLCDLLKDFGLTTSTLGVEDAFMPASQMRQFEGLLPTAKLVSGAGAFEEARVIKLPWEIAFFRNAAYQTDKAIMTGFAAARVGDTEHDLATSIQSLALRAGAQTFAHTVCSSGVQGTVVHALPLPKPIKLGEAIHVDFGGKFEGYCTDLSRTAMVGRPTDRQRSIHQTLWDARAAMFEQLRPGTVAKDLYAINGAVLGKQGLTNPWGTVGHSTGLKVHEGFDITATSEAVLEPNMIINIEPTHIEAGDARYHIEDSVLITETGYEVLSDYYNSNEMFVIR